MVVYNNVMTYFLHSYASIYAKNVIAMHTYLYLHILPHILYYIQLYIYIYIYIICNDIFSL